MLTDTHCHIADNAFDADREETIQRSLAAGVTRMIVACCDETEYPAIIELCKKHPHHLFPTIGLHPENMASDLQAQLHRLDQLLDPNQVIAVGEIGIDLHWDKSRLDDQKTALAHQLRWCLQHQLPAILHIRDAMPEFLQFMAEFCDEAVASHLPSPQQHLHAVLHCYSGTAEEFLEAQKYGIYYIGIGGTSTYKKSAVPEVLLSLPRQLLLERLVLETDCPYLSPMPHRGKRNEPAYTRHTAEFIARLLDMDLEELSRRTEENAERLFSDLKCTDSK